MAFDNVGALAFSGIKTVPLGEEGVLGLFLFVREDDGLVVGEFGLCNYEDVYFVRADGPYRQIEGHYLGVDNALRALGEVFGGTNG